MLNSGRNALDTRSGLSSCYGAIQETFSAPAPKRTKQSLPMHLVKTRRRDLNVSGRELATDDLAAISALLDASNAPDISANASNRCQTSLQCGGCAIVIAVDNVSFLVSDRGLWREFELIMRCDEVSLPNAQLRAE